MEGGKEKGRKRKGREGKGREERGGKRRELKERMMRKEKKGRKLLMLKHYHQKARIYFEKQFSWFINTKC